MRNRKPLSVEKMTASSEIGLGSKGLEEVSTFELKWSKRTETASFALVSSFWGGKPATCTRGVKKEDNDDVEPPFN